MALFGCIATPAAHQLFQDMSFGEESKLAASITAAAFDQNAPTVFQAMRTTTMMDVKAAAAFVQHTKLPDDVRSLVQAVEQGSDHRRKMPDLSDPRFDAALQKARVVLNDMFLSAWEELDDKVIECKEYEELNRGHHDQVAADLARLGSQLGDLARIESQAESGTAQMEQEIHDLQETIEKETTTYNQIRASNDAEMTIRTNDLDVFTMILQFTKCADATSLMQRDSIRVCEAQSGKQMVLFSDSHLQEKYEHLLTPKIRLLISNVLLSVSGNRSPGSFLQMQQPMNTTTAVPPPVDPTPVAGEEGQVCSGDDCMKSCPPNPPDCGLLHDKLSLLWGDYKDKVDELQMEMNKNEFEWEELKLNLNEQLKALTSSKARFSTLLAEARSGMAGDREEEKMKVAEREELDLTYHEFMKKCKKDITLLAYRKMYAAHTVRNALLINATTCQTPKIWDCDVGAWVPSACSVSCDNACPDPKDPFACGGWQEVTRQVVVEQDRNHCGVMCPPMSRYSRCNQKKCPIDCEMSQWSGWSKCSADCEGGVQSHTRSILTKPLFGGQACNTQEESRPCNTMSCDRDCTLASWSAWTPCSKACDGGYQERHRHVLIPTRGFGKCPKSFAASRYEKQKCNVQNCVGDEMCVAKQDLIIAIDGSGSLAQNGFQFLKSFAVALLERYKTLYFGAAATRIGVLLFGNGVILDDGRTVSPAINVQPLTDDLSLVKAGLEGMVFKKGFTNMAQAFALAEVMYTAKGRAGAQSAILVITDGKPSFSFQTGELVQQLEDKNIQRFFMVVNENGGDELRQMETWASQPWETNLIHVPGLEILDADRGVWVQKALVMFCPMTASVTGMAQEEVSQGFMLVKESGICGDKGELLSTDANDASSCAYLAKGVGATAFLLGSWFRRGYCYASPMGVVQQQYSEWEQYRMDPTCPEIDGWTESQLFDFYAVAPQIPVEEMAAAPQIEAEDS